MTEYVIVIEDAATKVAAFVIGLDGVITTSRTVDEVIENIHEAIPFHLEGMHLHGDQLPDPKPMAKMIRVAL